MEKKEKSMGKILKYYEKIIIKMQAKKIGKNTQEKLHTMKSEQILEN